METPNTASLSRRWGELGASGQTILRVYRNFNAQAEAFRQESEVYEH
jgi:predicted DNA-binding WGR domain protein